jgi:hypothetical protein
VQGEKLMAAAGNAARAGSSETAFPLRGLSPGSYVIEIAARSADGAIARRTVSIVIK